MSDARHSRVASLFPGRPRMDGYLWLASLTVVLWTWFGRNLGGSGLLFVPGAAVLITFAAGSWASAFRLRMLALVLLVAMAIVSAASIGWLLIPTVGFMLGAVVHAEAQRGKASVGGPSGERGPVKRLDSSSIRWELDNDGEGLVWVTYKTDRGPVEKRFETFADFEAVHPDEAQFVRAYDVEDDSYLD